MADSYVAEATYVGYGINVSDISDRGIFDFMVKNSPADAEKLIEDTFGEKRSIDSLGQQEMNEVVDDIGWRLSDYDKYTSAADYIADKICEKTCRHLVCNVDDRFVAFAPIRFIDDAIKNGVDGFVRNKDDAKTLLSRYFPNETLTFGAIYEGEDETEGNFRMVEDSVR